MNQIFCCRLATTFFLTYFIFLPPVSAAVPLSEEQIDEGWIALFDGETLFGWQPTSDANWHVEDKVIRVDSGEPGWLMTTSQFADYQLHVEFRGTAETNSGIFLRSAETPTDPTKDCYEVNIAPADDPYPTGSLVALETSNADTADRQWHAFDIRVENDTLEVTLDGQQVVEYSEATARTLGHIGLQFREGPIQFRNIRLKPLRMESMFNGKDLSGWNTDRAEASRFQVTPEGELRVLDGRGQLETNARYGNFLMQLECFVDGEGLNSGIFFRCIPGDFMMGYEAQIHNGMVDGDPTRPVDCGTGGIFRRQDARRIVARDREWFAMAILAGGPHIACWVNGLQVSDWTDTRPPNKNPRRGQRLEPGTIAIQGHDPTTDFRFRDLRIVELPE